MTTAMPSNRLPDPAYDADFYRDVPVKRLIAWVIDALLIGLLVAIAVPFTAFTGLFFLPFLFLVTGFFYRWFTIAGGSATWGMRLTSIELRTLTGQRFDGGTAFLHTLGYTVSVSVFPLQLISIVLMLLTDRRQGLTDHILGTVAINRAAST